MAANITIRGAGASSGITAPVDSTPDRCPICHFSITPIDWTTGTIRFAGQKLERLMQCPNANCMHLFLARYELAGEAYMLKACLPAEIRPPVQSKTIQAISEDNRPYSIFGHRFITIFKP